MKQNFEACKRFLEDEFPPLRGKITGDNYPVEPHLELLRLGLTLVQLIAVLLYLLGDNLWTGILGYPQIPDWYLPIREYGFQFMLVLFFLLPQLINQQLVTGAFEILVDGDVAYSKLQSGRMPNGEDIVSIFTSLGMAVSR